MSKGLIVALGAVVVVIVLVASVLGYVSGVRNQGIDWETRLSNQYQDNQNYLSGYISGFYETLGVANLKSEKMDQILTNAVKGRYESSGGFSSKGAFFSAISEAYPDLSALNVFDKIVDYVQAQRTGYRDIQSKLLDMLRGYDKWRAEGFIRSFVVSSFLGIPSDRLEARLGMGVVKRGKDGRDQMYVIVLTEEAAKAYETGKMAPLKAK